MGFQEGWFIDPGEAKKRADRRKRLPECPVCGTKARVRWSNVGSFCDGCNQTIAKAREVAREAVSADEINSPTRVVKGG